ncbi:SRPBCC domain-containing protein [Paraburkholderia sp. ZP32-5]|uniref:SRPBCC domain-containing protein n=1 Tax=Paraburkholderia sp. ZP32-5 TaxID=2883245 RepID=UPI001F305268|nr:SRPBCC domain-containing protein [Paraburkholderia sp. ZP32-5]
MSEILWPEGYLPGTTDYYVSNETIVAGLSAARAWPFLADTARWSESYGEFEQIRIHDRDGTELRFGTRFQFVVGGVPVQAEINEYVAPTDGVPGRLAWHGWTESDGRKIAEAHCAWLIEDLPGTRVRILWQESLLGPAARELAQLRPRPALDAHQNWIEGIAAAALAARA